MIARFHSEIIERNFPIPDERDDLECFVEILLNVEVPTNKIQWNKNSFKNDWQHVIIAMSEPFDAANVR